MWSLALRRSATALLLVAHVPVATGCTSWKTSQGSVETVVAARPEVTPHTGTAPANALSGLASTDSTRAQGESIRISTAAGANLVLMAPHIATDTLFGRVKADSAEVAIPVADITSVQTRQGSTGKTLGLVLGIAVPVGLVVGGMVALSNSLSCLYWACR